MENKLLDYMNQVTKYYTKSNGYTGQEVAELFLESEKTLKQQETDTTQTSNHTLMDGHRVSDASHYNMDLDELEKWRKKNNNKFTIRASLPITSHRKIIGKFIVRAKRIARHCLKWYIDPIVEQQNEFNGSVTASVNAIYNNDVVANQFMQEVSGDIKLQQHYLQQHAEEIKGAFAQIQMLSNELGALKQELQIKEELEQMLKDEIKQLKSVLVDKVDEEIQQIQEQLEHKEEQIQQLIEKDAQVEESIREMHQEFNEETSKLEDRVNKEVNQLANQLTNAIQQSANSMQQQMEATCENIHYLTYKFNKAKKEGIKVQLVEAKPMIEEKGLEVKEGLELDYFLFENRFRGTEKSIKKNQEQYLKYYKDKKNILDIGCGRGEFLELLSEHHIPATGIDVYDEFVEYCQDKGLNAKEDDALSYVRRLADNSIDGIFMSQVAEHLENDYLLNLLAEAYAKLQKGSYFIAETPNPTNLSTFTNNFYLDPSHVKPVHPATFKFMLEYVGFKEVEVVYTESSKPGYRLPLLEVSGGANLAEFNSGINCVTDMLFGSLDYAIIAKK